MILPENLTKQLIGKGETGMGYQVCSAKTKDGKVIGDILVANCSVVISVAGGNPSGVNFDNVVEITVDR